ncbi:transposase [Streptomyces sp. NPDC047085]|uniref:transposase n=1 Tax=Streptomyces sp. NPDC047085 TaxID=3155140 RepID=UPI0033EF9FEE
MQRLLRSTRWDAEAVRDDIRAYVHETPRCRRRVLIVDETGFLKKGAVPVGMQRQCTAGRVENTERAPS